MKLTFPQHCALVDLSESRSSTASMIGSSEATMKALLARDLVNHDGPNRKGKMVYRITDAGRKALEGQG